MTNDRLWNEPGHSIVARNLRFAGARLLVVNTVLNDENAVVRTVVDTGATFSAFHDDILNRLGLQPSESQLTSYVGVGQPESLPVPIYRLQNLVVLGDPHYARQDLAVVPFRWGEHLRSWDIGGILGMNAFLRLRGVLFDFSRSADRPDYLRPFP